MLALRKKLSACRKHYVAVVLQKVCPYLLAEAQRKHFMSLAIRISLKVSHVAQAHACVSTSIRPFASLFLMISSQSKLAARECRYVPQVRSHWRSTILCWVLKQDPASFHHISPMEVECFISHSFPFSYFRCPFWDIFLFQPEEPF